LREPLAMGVDHAPATARRRPNERADVVDMVACRLRLDELVEQPQLVVPDNIPHDVAPSSEAESSRSAAGEY